MLMILQETRNLLDYLQDSPDNTFERDVNNAMHIIKKHYGIENKLLYAAKEDDSEEVKALAASRLLYKDGKPEITLAIYREIP